MLVKVEAVWYEVLLGRRMDVWRVCLQLSFWVFGLLCRLTKRCQDSSLKPDRETCDILSQLKMYLEQMNYQ